MASLIKSIALQIAQEIPSFRQVLLDMVDTGYKVKDTEWRALWRKIFVNSLLTMDLPRPQYWVIDALDEAQFPGHLFDLLSDINASKSPIKVLVTSRWTPVLSSAFNRASSKISTLLLSMDSEFTDIELYVKEELAYSDWDAEITDGVVAKLLSRSNNNFLWVYLALEEVKDCNTEEDLDQRLSELPSGMDELYERMGETISEIRRPSDLKLACQLLTWATHSQRPLGVDELLDILEPEFGRLLNIQQTLIRLCGHFVVLETDNRVGLIHHTAREYLNSTTTLPFSLEAGPSHSFLLKQSVLSFKLKNMRHKVEQTNARVVEYRATSWPHHLAMACETSNQTDEHVDILDSFLHHNSALIWIHALALLGQLEVLTHTVESLSSLLRISIMGDTVRINARGEPIDVQYLEGWSRDFLKVLGKFGNSILEQPDSIYTNIAPFCPTSSSISKAFGRSSDYLTVRGLPVDWDDCLARMAIDSDGGFIITTALRCSARHIAVSTGSGLTILWDTKMFQATSIDHGEHIWDLCFNTKGDRFATYGYYTTKIWASEHGQLQQTIPNPLDMNVKSLMFVEKDTVLMMASDQQTVLRASLSEEPAAWNLGSAMSFIDRDWLESNNRSWSNAPSMMVISPDGTKIATVHKRQPLTIWSISSTEILRRLIRPMKVSSDNASKPTDFVSHMSWHPSGDGIMGILMDGCTFKLSLGDGKYEEKRPHHSNVPRSIVCSPDGLTYAICCVSGTIQLFDYQTSALLYELVSEDAMNHFSFSHDGQRFCDIRQGFCSIWAPDATSHSRTISGRSPSTSHYSRLTSPPSMEMSGKGEEKAVSVNLMSPMPRGGPLVLLGNEDGAVELIDCITSERIPIHEGYGSSLRCAAWNNTGEKFCYVQNVGGKITVMRLDQGSSSRQARQLDQFKPKGAGGVLISVLFLTDETSSEILVVRKFAAQVWSLEPATLRGEIVFEPSVDHRMWIGHPRSRDHVLSVGTADVSVHTRSNLEMISAWNWEQRGAQQQQALDLKQEILDVKPTYYRDYIMVRIGQEKGSRRLRSRFSFFDAATIPTSRTDENGVIASPSLIEIPEDKANLMEFPLNVLPSGRLVFISRSFWVCSWRLKSHEDGGSANNIERHFFIPRDWLAVKSQGLLHLTASGHIIFPREKGGVSVIEISIF